VIVVSFTTVKLCAAVPANDTPVAPVKPVPLIVTLVPPAIGPEAGVMLMKVGVETYVNRVLFALLPADVVTTTLTGPTLSPAGTVAVIEVELLTE
jgi:hypothetical protein